MRNRKAGFYLLLVFIILTTISCVNSIDKVSGTYVRNNDKSDTLKLFSDYSFIRIYENKIDSGEYSINEKNIWFENWISRGECAFNLYESEPISSVFTLKRSKILICPEDDVYFEKMHD